METPEIVQHYAPVFSPEALEQFQRPAVGISQVKARRFHPGVLARPTPQMLDLTSLTLDEFRQLVLPFIEFHLSWSEVTQGR